MIRNSRPEMEKAQQILAGDSRRKFELRFLDELFIFTKCEKPEAVSYTHLAAATGCADLMS